MNKEQTQSAAEDKVKETSVLLSEEDKKCLYNFLKHRSCFSERLVNKFKPEPKWRENYKPTDEDAKKRPRCRVKSTSDGEWRNHYILLYVHNGDEHCKCVALNTKTKFSGTFPYCEIAEDE